MDDDQRIRNLHTPSPPVRYHTHSTNAHPSSVSFGVPPFSSLSFQSSSSLTPSVHTPTLLMELSQPVPTPLAVSAAEKALHAANDDDEPPVNPIHTASAIDQAPSTSSRLQPQTHHPLPPASDIHPSPNPSHPLSTLNVNRGGRGNHSNARVTPTNAKNQTGAPHNVGLTSGAKLLSTRTRLRTLSPDELITRLDRKAASSKRATPGALSRKLFLECADVDLPYVAPRHLSRRASLSASTTQQAPVDYADVDMVPSQFSGDVQEEQNKAVDDDSPTDLLDTQNGLEDDAVEENILEDQLDNDYCVDDSEGQATSDEPVNGAPDLEPINPILTQAENTSEERKDYFEAGNDVEHNKLREEARVPRSKKEDIIVSPRGDGVSHTDPPKSFSKSAVDSTSASAKRRGRRSKRKPVLDETKSSTHPDVDVGSNIQAAEKNSIPTNHSNSNLPSLEVELDQNDQTGAARLRSVEEQSHDVTTQVEATDVVPNPNPPRRRRGRPRKNEKLAKNVQDAGTENSKDVKTTNTKYEQTVSENSGSRNDATASTDLKQLEKEHMDENVGNSSSKAGRSAKKRRMRVSRRELPEKIAGTDQDIDMEVLKNDGIGHSNSDGVNPTSLEVKRLKTPRKSKRIEYSPDDVAISNDHDIPTDAIDNPTKKYKRRTSQSEKQVSKKRVATTGEKPTVRPHRHRKVVREESDLDEFTPGQADVHPPSIPSPNVLNVSADEETGSKSKHENQVGPSPFSGATPSSIKRTSEGAQNTKQGSRKRVATTGEKSTVRPHRHRKVVREESDLDEFTPGQADVHPPSIPSPNVLNVSADEETGSKSNREAQVGPSPSSGATPSSIKRTSEGAQNTKQGSRKRVATTGGKGTVGSHRHRKIVREESDLDEYTPGQASADEETGSKSKHENQVGPSPFSGATPSSKKRPSEVAQSTKQGSRKRVATTGEKSTVRPHRHRKVVREESDLDEFTPGQADVHPPSIPSPNVLNVSADEETGSKSNREAQVGPSPSSGATPSSIKRTSEGAQNTKQGSRKRVATTGEKSTVRPHRHRKVVREESDLDEFTPGQADVHPPSIPSPNVLNVSADEETGSKSNREAQVGPSPSSGATPSSRKRSAGGDRGRHLESNSSLVRTSTTPRRTEVKPTKSRQRRDEKQNEPKPRSTPRNSKSTRLGPSSGKITKKARRRSGLSEVLKLQKSLASAAWTDSKAVERQTEVIDLEKEYDSVSPRQTDVLPVRQSQVRGSGYGRRLSSSHAASPMSVGGGQTPRKDRVEKATPKKTKPHSNNNNNNHGGQRNVRSAERKQTKNKASDAPKPRARPKYTIYESDADDVNVDDRGG